MVKASVAGGYVLFGLWIPMNIAFVVALLTRRKFHPLDKRSTPLMLVAQIASNMVVLWGALYMVTGGTVPCGVTMAFGTLFPAMYFVAYVLRAFRLIALHRRNLGLMELVVTKHNLSNHVAATVTSSDSDYEHHGKRISSMARRVNVRLFATQAGFVTLALVSIIFRVAMDPELYANSSSTECVLFSSLELLAGYFLGASVFACCIGVYIQRLGINDSLAIRNELLFCSCAWLVAGVFLVLAVLIDISTHTVPTEVSVGGIAVFTSAVSQYIPVLRTYPWFQRATLPWLARQEDVAASQASLEGSKALSAGRPDLRTILDHKIGVEYLSRYMVSEFSVENLLFYFASSHVIDMQEKLPGSDGVVKAAEDLHRTFLAPEAPLAVNLSSRVRTQCIDAYHKAAYESESSDLVPALVAARHEVYALMRSSTYPRFVASPSFHEMQRAAATSVSMIEVRRRAPSEASLQVQRSKSAPSLAPASELPGSLE